MNAPTSLGVVILGASGRMGSFCSDLIAGDDRFHLSAAIGSSDKLENALQAAGERGARVALDLTVAGLGARHGLAALNAGLRPVIGTSGVRPEECQQLDELAHGLHLGGLIVPNFSLGVWLQLELTRLAAKHMSAVEIIEEHGVHKKDAPSGTAAHTAQMLGELLDRPAESIPIHSVRLPGVQSNQSVLFGGEGQLLRITHETYGYQAFGPGILCSLLYAAQAEGVQVGVGHAFRWESCDG